MFFRRFLAIQSSITILILLSFSSGRHISPSYADIDNVLPITYVASKDRDTLFSFNAPFLWEEPHIQTINTTIDHAITYYIPTQPTQTPPPSVSPLKEEVESIALHSKKALVSSTDNTYPNKQTLENISKLLTYPIIKNLATHSMYALWFGYYGPDPFGYFGPHRFIANFVIYTTAQLFSMFTSYVPGAQIFNFYKVYLHYLMFGLQPAGRALFFTIINQLVDWTPKVPEPTSMWRKVKSFVANNKTKIKVGLWATNTLYGIVSNLLHGGSSFSSNSNDIRTCEDVVYTLNEAIKISNNSPRIEALPANTTVKMVTKAYRSLAKIFHPDMLRHQKIQNANGIWLRIVKAKDFFMDNCKK